MAQTSTALELLSKALLGLNGQGKGDGEGEGKSESQPEDGKGKGEPGEGDQESDGDSKEEENREANFGNIPSESRGDFKPPEILPEIQAIIQQDEQLEAKRLSKDSPQPLPAEIKTKGYKNPGKIYDRVMRADALFAERCGGSLRRRREVLDDNYMRGADAIVGRLASKLQRVIMAQQMRSWSFDHDDGHLDPARLSRIVSSPTSPVAYRQEHESKFKETAITLLLDNSGSMSGDKIQTTACVADILTRALERCGVKVEVLGFTTQHKLATGEGRNEGLEHIIYKDSNTPYRRIRDNFGLMMMGLSFLNDNIDGESLTWAYNRLVCRPEPRRILIVISDGEPAGFYEHRGNDFHQSFLYDHLHDVINEIQRRGDVELFAIGIENDVTRWYKHAAMCSDVTEAAMVLMTELTRMFEKKRRAR